MATSITIHSLAAQLGDDLLRAYIGDQEGHLEGGQPLREAFGRFGHDAAVAGIPLEEAMAASADALQHLFARVGGSPSDPSTFVAAGISLAAVARAYEGGRDEQQTDVKAKLPTQLARLAALHRINRAATANLALTEMLDTTVRVVAETTGSDACAVFLYDEATDSLALRAAVGLNASSVNAVAIRPGAGITGRAASERRLIAASDARSHEAYLTHPVIGDDVYTSQASVPMLLRTPDRLVGVLNILTIARREFDTDEIEFLQTVAGELAISIANARRYSQTEASLRRKVAELGTLQRVSRTVASTLDLSDVLRLISEQAVELINAEAAAIFRLPHAPGGGATDSAPNMEYLVGYLREIVNPDQRNELVRQVVQSGTALAEDVAYADGFSRLYCQPLRSARETFGALCLRLRPGVELTEEELGLLQAFSDSASLAIENAQLYQDARHGLETASALLQEMHHRVRNNLQTVAALLSLQIRSAEDASWAGELREAVSRIQAIAAVHDLLSDERRLGGTTVDVIARHVAEGAHGMLVPPGLTVKFDIAPSDVAVPSRQATILALLINELVANAISHGFEDRSRGRIAVRAHRAGGIATVVVANDGHHVPEGFDPAKSPGLGMRIVQRLVTSDLRGEFVIRSDEGDTVATITFPLAEADGAGEN